MTMQKSMSLKSQILLVIASVTAFLVIIGCIGIYSLNQVSAKAEHIATVNVVNSVLLGNMLAKSKAIESDAFRMAHPALSEKDFSDAKDKLQEDVEDYEKAGKMFLSGQRSAEEQELYDKQSTGWTTLKPLIEKMLDFAGSKESGKKDELIEIALGEFSKLSSDHQAQLEALFNFQNDEGYKWAQAVKETTRTSNLASLISMLVGFTFATIIGLGFANRLSTILKSLALEISTGADSLLENAQQMGHTSDALASSSTEQAATLDRTASAVHQVSSMIDQNSSSSVTSAQSAKESRKSAESGDQAVNEVEAAILEISKSTATIATEIEKSHHEIAEIVKVIGEIGGKTKVINDIVFQTKLLSFNASVEAARAGEHGKGFAVVAEEVGNLARMSGNAAKEISDLLESSISKVESIVKQTSQRVGTLIMDGRKKVEQGTQTVSVCRDALGEIVSSVAMVNDAVQSIATASGEQATGMKEIDQAMSELNEATHANTQAASESALLAKQLGSHAMSLNSIVSRLRMTVEGSRGSPEFLARGHDDSSVHGEPMVHDQQLGTNAPMKVKKSA